MKYGFVYIWRDRKHNRYYIGCRWGSEDDGYVCSSTWMKLGYKKRPQDFKRRILSRVYTNRNDLLEEEHRWLQMIKNEELKTRYYNLRNHKFGHWTNDPEKMKEVLPKIGTKGKGGWKLKPERIEQLRQASTGNKYWLGRNHGDEAKAKMSEIAKSRPMKVCECCGKEVSSTTYNRWHGNKCGNNVITEETKKKMAAARVGRKLTEEHRQHIKEGLRRYREVF